MAWHGWHGLAGSRTPHSTEARARKSNAGETIAHILGWFRSRSLERGLKQTPARPGTVRLWVAMCSCVAREHVPVTSQLSQHVYVGGFDHISAFVTPYTFLWVRPGWRAKIRLQRVRSNKSARRTPKKHTRETRIRVVDWLLPA